MRRLKWRSGPLDGCETSVFVSATRFTYKRKWHLPLVFWHGHLLRRAWPSVNGAVGMSIGADISLRSTFTISVWRSEADLMNWIRSPGHLKLMRNFRSRLESSKAIGWSVDDFQLRAAWMHAMPLLLPPGLEIQKGIITQSRQR